MSAGRTQRTRGTAPRRAFPSCIRWMFVVPICIGVCNQLWMINNMSSFPHVPETSMYLPLLLGQHNESSSSTTRKKKSTSTPATIHNFTRMLDPMTKEKLKNAGLDPGKLDEGMLASLPSWATIESVLGSSKPHIIGLETCEAFRSIVNDEGPRFVGVSGFFNSGTNFLAYLLDENCEFEKGQPLWQVPWAKHSMATQRNHLNVAAYKGCNKTRTLPAVIVRNPYYVFESMCRNSYAVDYQKNVNSTCPHMLDYQTGELVSVEARLATPSSKFPSIVHFWNKWYQEYLSEFPHPRLLIRLEDLTIHPKETITTICECAGGSMAEGFSYLMESAKEGDGHGNKRNGLLEGWNRLRHEVPFLLQDYEAVRAHLDEELMAAFLYKPPPRNLSSTWNEEETGYHKYDSLYWKELPRNIKNAMAILGYDQHMWDETNFRPGAFEKSWADLTGDEKVAIQEIGGNEESWDSE